MITTPLGKEYGLIFQNENEEGEKELVVSPDGKEVEKIQTGEFDPLLYSQNDETLYYATNQSLKEFPNKNIINLASSMPENKEITDLVQNAEGEIYMSTESGKIYDSQGNMILDVPNPVYGIALFNEDMAVNTRRKDIYERGGNIGKIRLDDMRREKISEIAKIDSHTNKGSKLINSGNKTYYQQFHRKDIEERHEEIPPIAPERYILEPYRRSINQVKEADMGGIDGAYTEKGNILYIGRKNENGIMEIPTESQHDQRKLLPNKAYNVKALTLAPLEFIEQIAQYRDS